MLDELPEIEAKDPGIIHGLCYGADQKPAVCDSGHLGLDSARTRLQRYFSLLSNRSSPLPDMRFSV
jgi:hypothetical protein